MTITVVLNQRLKPERADEFSQEMAGIIAQTREQDGCVAIQGYRNQSDPTHLVVIEEWESGAHHEAYVAWRRSTGALAKFADSLQEAPNVAYFDQIA